MIPGLVRLECKNYNVTDGSLDVNPCEAVCPEDDTRCLDAADSEVATCYPQWTAYQNSSSSWASTYRPDYTTMTYTEIDTYPISIYPSLSTDSTWSRQYYDGSWFNPVYALGTPSVSTSYDTWEQAWTFPAGVPHDEERSHIYIYGARQHHYHHESRSRGRHHRLYTADARL